METIHPDEADYLVAQLSRVERGERLHSSTRRSLHLRGLITRPDSRAALTDKGKADLSISRVLADRSTR